MSDIKTDVAIIGTGSAGLNAYRAVKATGKNAVLIEGGPYGTTCARVGCMPSKLLIAAAETVHHIDLAEGFGIHVATPDIDGRAVMHRVRHERDRFVGFVVESVENIPSEDRIRGMARFLDPSTLLVNEELKITAERFVIATGSRPYIPEFLRPVSHRVLINDDIFDWQDLPSSVAVFGTGVIAMELAQALHRLRVRVTVYGRSGRIGPFSDPKVLQTSTSHFTKDMDMVPSPRAMEVNAGGPGVRIRCIDGQGKLREDEFEWVIAATGRVPNLEKLQLTNSGLSLNKAGLPVINPDTLQAEAQPIFFAGDCTGEKMILHEASDEGRIAGANAAQWPNVTAQDRRAPLEVVFTDPQMVMVGTRFEDLPQEAQVGEISFSSQGRSRIHLMNHGLMRLYASGHTRKFLGAEMLGPRMEHMGHLLAWALQANLTVPQMLEMPFYHPVFEEGLRTGLRDLNAKYPLKN